MNFGGWRNQANWIDEWTHYIWNTRAWIIQRCDVVPNASRGMVEELDFWPDSVHDKGFQEPLQGFLSERYVRGWRVSESCRPVVASYLSVWDTEEHKAGQYATPVRTPAHVLPETPLVT